MQKCIYENEADVSDECVWPHLYTLHSLISAATHRHLPPLISLQYDYCLISIGFTYEALVFLTILSFLCVDNVV